MQFARACTFCLRAEMYAREHGVSFRTELDFMLAGTSVPTAPVHLVMRFVAADACYLSTTQTVTPDWGKRGGEYYVVQVWVEKKWLRGIRKTF